jgi:hypothetical protein
MQSIRNVFAAFANLAASLNALASVVDTATGRLRQSLALDETPAMLPGDVIDAEPEPAATRRNGRTKTTA